MSREIEFGGRKIKPSIRHLYDMKEVIYDREWLKTAENVPLYFMYRGLYQPRDKETIGKNGLRYDVTVMPARKLGKEFVKTKGHYHPKANSVTYPELYGVLEGEAHYFLQNLEDGEVTRTVLIEAEAGDKVIVPPGYGHITINPSDERLKMANWVYRKFESIYGPIVEKGGGAWFELVDGFVKNKNYRNVPELEKIKASENDPFTGEIYDLIEEPDKLQFLINPGNNKEVFEGLEYY